MAKEGVRRAVFDIGSSSVLLLVAEFREGAWRRLVERCVVTRLSEGLPATDVLSEAAMSRTAAACAELLREALTFDPERVTAVGSMVFRVASNASEILERLRNVGLETRVLAPDEEARLSFHSVRSDPVFRDRSDTVIDIGGASTEICDARAAHSYPVGAAVLAAGTLGPGPCSDSQVTSAVARVDSLLTAAPLEYATKVATVGSTGVNLACLARRNAFDPDAVHGAALSLDEVRIARERLCSLSPSERAVLRGLEQGREAAIHAGALILERVLVALGASGVLVSCRGLRWALLDDPGRGGE